MNYRKLVVLVMMCCCLMSGWAEEVLYNNTTTDNWAAWDFSNNDAVQTPMQTDIYATLTCDGYSHRGYIKTQEPVPQFTRLFFRAKQTGGYQYGYAVQYSENGTDNWHDILTGRAPTNEFSNNIEAAIDTPRDVYIRIRVTFNDDNTSAQSRTLTIDQIEIMHNVANCDNCFPIHIE